MNAKKGFTLVEVLITFTLGIVLLGMIGLAGYMRQYNTGYDVVKKNDLAQIRDVLESFYKDNSRYPSAQEITFALVSDTNLAGYLCGEQYLADIIKPYTNSIPCHPKHKNGVDYVYFSYNNNQEFVIFTNLENTDDPVIAEAGCDFGCSYFTSEADPEGSISSTQFNYAVYSSMEYMEVCKSSPAVACINGICNSCLGNEQYCSTLSQIWCNVSWCIDDPQFGEVNCSN